MSERWCRISKPRADLHRADINNCAISSIRLQNQIYQALISALKPTSMHSKADVNEPMLTGSDL